MRLTKMALNAWDVNFFHKIYSLWLLIFYMKLLKKFKIGSFWADWYTPPFVQRCPNCGAPNTRVGNLFFRKWTHWPTFNLDFFTGIIWNFLKLGPIRPIGRQPHLSKMASIVGPQIYEFTFLQKIDPISICILYRKLLKNLQFGPFLSDRQTPYLSKFL